MRIQITTLSLDSKKLNAFIDEGILQTQKNNVVVLQKYSYSGSSKLEDQETIVSISQDPETIGIIYSS